jgi:hypothetical protein
VILKALMTEKSNMEDACRCNINTFNANLLFYLLVMAQIVVLMHNLMAYKRNYNLSHN